jgi:23S rRNA pseudouridine2605 synthase
MTESRTQNRAQKTERLQKILAAAGVCSRRKAEEFILAGRVQVNGKIVSELGTKADAAHDHIRVDGKLLHGVERLRYYMINKPKGYVTTVSDPQNRPTVMQLIRRGERVFPVGRLDYSSEGLLLMTNDGELANALTRAAAKVEKTYLVKVSGKPSPSGLEQIRTGMMIERGKPGSHEGRVLTTPAKVRLFRDAENPWYELVMIEGRNREIRKMFEEIGHHVEKIRRIGYGPLVLDLEPGEARELAEQEVEKLRRAVRPPKSKPAAAGAQKRSRSKSSGVASTSNK